MRVKSENEVAQSYPTFSNPMDCSLPGSPIHGIFPGKSTGILRIDLKDMKTNWPRELKINCTKNNQDDAGQTIDDQFQDDCQSWLCGFCM